MRRFVTVVALCAATFVLPAAGSSPAWAMGACNSVREHIALGSGFVNVPAINSSDISCQLGVGNQGRAVSHLQHTINFCYRGLVSPIAEDGSFGPQTREALKAVQRHSSSRGYAIPIDGVYGPMTRDAMYHPSAGGGLFCGMVDGVGGL
jgi:peptidoglycan hydrolase-like protein with peptidoglycan-binding domain